MTTDASGPRRKLSAISVSPTCAHVGKAGRKGRGYCDERIDVDGPTPPVTSADFGGAADVRGGEQARAEDESERTHRSYEQPGILLSEQAARERTEEHRSVDADTVHAHPPRKVLGARVLADDAD